MDLFPKDFCALNQKKKNNNDYHDECVLFVNGYKVFYPNSRTTQLKVKVMDDAPYHSVKVEKSPTTNWRKSDIAHEQRGGNRQYDDN